MLEQFFDNDFKGFREDIMSELNSRIYSAIQEKKQEVAENFFTEATQPSKKKKKTESCTENDKKIAAADFAMKQDVYGEEVEQIDELKKETLGSYIKKALNDYGAERSTAGSLALGSEYRKEALKAARKRDKGIKTATDKLVKGDYQNEDVEQIDELKASTLGSYIKKAAKEMGNSYVVQQTQGLGKIGGPTEEDKKIINAAQKHAFKRGKGSQKAEYKLATGNYQNESTLSEDTAEYLVDIKYPDGTSQKDFRIIGATEEDVRARLNKIFGGIPGYTFDNFRLNH